MLYSALVEYPGTENACETCEGREVICVEVEDLDEVPAAVFEEAGGRGYSLSGCLITAVVEGRCESEDEFRDARLAQDERAAELKRQEDEELAWQEYAERIGN